MPGGSPEFAGQPVETNRCVPHSVRDPVLKKKVRYTDTEEDI